MKIGHLRSITPVGKSELRVEMISHSDNEKDEREELRKRLQDVECRYKTRIENSEILRLYDDKGKEISHVLPACKLTSLLV